MNRLTDLPNWMSALAAQPRIVVLAALVIAAAVTDARTRRIPNELTFGGAALGLVFAAAGVDAGPSLADALGGALFGLAVLLPLYVMRAAGAGDVKLMTLVGTFLGLPDVLFAFALTCVIGGVMAFAFAMRRRSVGRMVLNVRDLVALTAFAAVHGQRPATQAMPSVGRLPYAVCVCAGTLLWLAWVQLHR